MDEIDGIGPPFICTERSGSVFEVWRLCGECSVYHGPIAVCTRKLDAEEIVRALTNRAAMWLPVPETDNA